MLDTSTRGCAGARGSQEHSEAKLITGFQTPSNTEHLTCPAACSRFPTRQHQAVNREFARLPRSLSMRSRPCCAHAPLGTGTMLVTTASMSGLTQPGEDKGWHKLSRARAPAMHGRCTMRVRVTLENRSEGGIDVNRPLQLPPGPLQQKVRDSEQTSAQHRQ